VEKQRKTFVFSAVWFGRMLAFERDLHPAPAILDRLYGRISRRR
jgi:hypothetical protein